MKATALPARINMFVTHLLDALVQEAKPSTESDRKKSPLESKRHRSDRKDFFYYMQLIDQDTQEIVGHLADISSGGFKLDSEAPIPINKDFRFLMNLTSEVAGKPFMVFAARSKWCKVDPLDPYVYNIGYQLIHISAGDLEIFSRMMDKYGREPGNRNLDLRRSNKW